MAADLRVYALLALLALAVLQVGPEANRPATKQWRVLSARGFPICARNCCRPSSCKRADERTGARSRRRAGTKDAGCAGDGAAGQLGGSLAGLASRSERADAVWIWSVCDAGWALPLAKGLHTLVTVSPPEPVSIATEPLLGDIRLLWSIPSTGLHQRTIPGSTGDIWRCRERKCGSRRGRWFPSSAPKFTVIADGQESSQPVQVGKPKAGQDAPLPLLSASLVVQKRAATTLSSKMAIKRCCAGDKATELRSNRIIRRGSICLRRCELEVTSTRRVELAYSAEDDFGLAISIWSIGLAAGRNGDEGPIGTDWGQQNRRQTDAEKRHQHPDRTAQLGGQDRMGFERAGASAGVQVTYFAEARDLNNVTGPGVGRSREYAVYPKPASASGKRCCKASPSCASKRSSFWPIGLMFARTHPQAQRSDRFVDGCCRSGAGPTAKVRRFAADRAGAAGLGARRKNRPRICWRRCKNCRSAGQAKPGRSDAASGSAQSDRQRAPRPTRNSASAFGKRTACRGNGTRCAASGRPHRAAKARRTAVDRRRNGTAARSDAATCRTQKHRPTRCAKSWSASFRRLSGGLLNWRKKRGRCPTKFPTSL